MPTPIPPAPSRLARLLLATVCALAIVSPARAAERGTMAAAPVVEVGRDEGAVARRLEMSIGRSLVVDLPRDAKEVFVANPKVANAVVRSTRKIFVIGIENGATSIFVMDADGRQIAALEVTVGRDLNVLQQTLQATLPHAAITIKPAGDSILMTGVVASASEAQQAVDIANAFVGVSGGLLGGTKGAVVNALTIRGKDQVMLRVTVAEVARSVIKQFGVSTNGSWSAFDLGTTATFPIAPQTLAGNNVFQGTAQSGNFSARARLESYERAGVSRVLAEPTLVAISGEAATFTAGGEIPIPKSEECERESIGGLFDGACRVTVEYKPFGVNLSFTPVVLSEGRISMRVATEVTELDYENQFRFNRVNVPGIKVRKSATTVELASGASMMTAGLISNQSAQAVSGLPGAMNLPILGTLFRSRDYQRRETELTIIVTPFIAKPMDAAQVQRPDDNFVDAHDAQTVLLGRLNRLYGVAGGAGSAKTYKGKFGFITD